MQEYSNDVIQMDHLPQWKEVPFEPISPKYRSLILINTFLTWLFLAGGSFTFLYFLPETSLQSSLMVAAALTIVIACYLVFNLISFRRRGYAMREHDVLYKAGVFTHYTLIIPFRHIQHVKIRSSFVSRNLGLVSMELFTAGSGRDMRISGLDRETGLLLQQHLSERISAHKSDEASRGEN